LLPKSLLCHAYTQEMWKERLPVKTEAKTLLSILSVVASLPVLLIGVGMLSSFSQFTFSLNNSSVPLDWATLDTLDGFCFGCFSKSKYIL